MSGIDRMFPPYPALRQPTMDELQEILLRHGEAKLRELAAKYAEDVANFQERPFEHPFRIAKLWDQTDALLAAYVVVVLFGGNRSSKTRYALEKLVRWAVENGKKKILFLVTNDRRSKLIHQAPVFHLLPAEWKQFALSNKRSKTLKMSYKEGDGWTDNLCILPNGTRLEFGFYTAPLGTYEGDEYDFIFADEDLPLSWFKTLLWRLYSRKGKFLWAFTPVDGITPAIHFATAGAKTEKHDRAEMLPEDHEAMPGKKKAQIYGNTEFHTPEQLAEFAAKAKERDPDAQDWPPGHMPILQINKSIPGAPAVAIQYYWPEFNPFAGYEAMKRDMKLLPAVEKERRFYGFCRALAGVVFARFGSRHTLPADWVPPKRVTWFQAGDPASRRNPFFLWGCVDDRGKIYIVREWPDRATYGEWAVPSEESKKHDGQPGPATVSVGWGTERYKAMFDEVERDLGRLCGLPGPVVVTFRWLDPRYAAQAVAAAEEGGSTILERFALVGVYFAPAAGKDIKVGELEIKDLLDDATSPGKDAFAEPMLFVHPQCGNLMDALRNYTGLDGESGAQKDPIDTLRYVVTSGPVYCGEMGAMEVPGGGW